MSESVNTLNIEIIPSEGEVNEELDQITITDEVLDKNVLTNAIDLVQFSPVPTPMDRESKVFSEDLYTTLMVNSNRNSEVNMSELGLEGESVEMITVVAYAKGDGIAHQLGKFAPIGHRDMLIYRDNNGELRAYSDFKSNDYRTGTELIDVQDDAMDRFYSADRRPGSGIAVERVYTQLSDQARTDPYSVGIGSYMQALALGYLVKKGIKKIDTRILTVQGEQLWQKFGFDTSRTPMEYDEDQLVKVCSSILADSLF